MDEHGRNPARPHLRTRPRTPAGAEAIAGLEALGESVHEADDAALRKLDLRSTDALALLHVVQAAAADRPLSPTALASRLGITTAAVTKLVDRLSRAGRAERRPNPRDRRGIVVVPSADAAADLEQAYGHITSPLVQVVDELSDAEAEVIARFARRLGLAIRLGL
jgi:DNA-binding MarR family transcriptional regulator